MDHGLVKRLRGEVGDRLAEQRRLDAAAGMPPMTGEDERQVARALVSQVLEEHARSEILVGRPPLNAQDEEDLAEAIHAALFGVGRLQPLLEDQNIENIDINGYDRVFIGDADGSEQREGRPAQQHLSGLRQKLHTAGMTAACVPEELRAPQKGTRRVRGPGQHRCAGRRAGRIHGVGLPEKASQRLVDHFKQSAQRVGQRPGRVRLVGCEPVCAGLVQQHPQPLAAGDQVGFQSTSRCIGRTTRERCAQPHVDGHEHGSSSRRTR